jgi:hypothetical protein
MNIGCRVWSTRHNFDLIQLGCIAQPRKQTYEPVVELSIVAPLPARHFSCVVIISSSAKIAADEMDLSKLRPI